jgi:hypothetical protein
MTHRRARSYKKDFEERDERPLPLDAVQNLVVSIDGFHVEETLLRLYSPPLE